MHMRKSLQATIGGSRAGRMARKKAVFDSVEKTLHISKGSLYNSGLFGRNDKRQIETTEMGA